MTIEEARLIVGKAMWYPSNAPDQSHRLRNMVLALEMHSWNNTPEETLRLEAAKMILNGKEKK